MKTDPKQWLQHPAPNQTVPKTSQTAPKLTQQARLGVPTPLEKEARRIP